MRLYGSRCTSRSPQLNKWVNLSTSFIHCTSFNMSICRLRHSTAFLIQSPIPRPAWYIFQHPFTARYIYLPVENRLSWTCAIFFVKPHVKCALRITLNRPCGWYIPCFVYTQPNRRNIRTDHRVSRFSLPYIYWRARCCVQPRFLRTDWISTL